MFLLSIYAMCAPISVFIIQYRRLRILFDFFSIKQNESNRNHIYHHPAKNSVTYSGEESNTPESFGEPFTEYAQSLKDGECSPVLETESCYAILKMITVNDEEIADQIMQHYRAEMEEEAVTEKKKEG